MSLPPAAPSAAPPNVIHADRLSRTFLVTRKQPGLLGSLRSLFARERVSRHAVREVSFDVAEGEIVGLVGANGAGKTTLVKMLSGIIHPTGGDATVLGHRPWRRDNRFRRQIALIMGQKAQLWWDLPAADCFLLLKEIYGLAQDDYEQSLHELTTMLELEDLLEIQIRRLSLGERMKLELVAALLHRPRVVFLDEPTIGLDLTSQRAIRDFLLAYRERHRPAMILTSHYMEDIERLCRRIVILREGRIVYDGSLADVAERHADHKVLRAHLKRGEGPPPEPNALARLGEVLRVDEGTLEVRVPRSRVAEAASWILGRHAVADLTIQEEDIGTVIESIQRARAGSSS